MKKSLITVTLILLSLGMISCNKDEDDINGDNSPITLQPEPIAEGAYTPAMKIARISGDKINETWTWSDNKLSVIQDDYTEYEFSYTGWQMKKIVMSGANDAYEDFVNMTTNYTYNGTLLTQIENVINDEPIASIAFQHNTNNKISHADLDIDTAYLKDFFDEYLGGVLPLFNSNKSNQKLGLTSNGISADLNWSGNNMTQMVVNASMNVIITVGEIQEVINTIGSENFGDYSEIVDLISVLNPDRELPLTLGIMDTIDYTFDNKNNPYYGFLYFKLSSGDKGIQGLSQNNILGYHSHGELTASFELQIIPGLPGETYSLPLPLLPLTQNYTYQYNVHGFPTNVTGKYGTFAITYSE